MGAAEDDQGGVASGETEEVEKDRGRAARGVVRGVEAAPALGRLRCATALPVMARVRDEGEAPTGFAGVEAAPGRFGADVEVGMVTSIASPTVDRRFRGAEPWRLAPRSEGVPAIGTGEVDFGLCAGKGDLIGAGRGRREAAGEVCAGVRGRVW
jgi:hypothetical protein